MKFSILISIVLYNGTLFGQTDSLNYYNSIEHAKNLYHQFIDPPTGLYNGSEYVNYYNNIKEGHPFFETPDFKTGTVFYDGVLYKNVQLQYDIIKNILVTQHSFYYSKIALLNEKIDSFSLLNHQFVKLTENESFNSLINNGFYEVLYNGPTTVYKKQKKTLLESPSVTEGLKISVTEKTAWFIFKENKYYKVGSKKDLLKIMKSRKNEMQQFLRKNKLSYKKDKDSTLINSAEYYDTLNK